MLVLERGFLTCGAPPPSWAPMDLAERFDLVLDALGELLAVLIRIDRTLRRIDMSDIPALDAEIANDLAPMVGQAVQALQMLENKLAGAGSPVDVSAEIASLRALHDSLSAAVDAANPPAAPVAAEPAVTSGPEGVAPQPSPADLAAQEAAATATNVDTTAPAPAEAAPAEQPTGDAGNPPAVATDPASGKPLYTFAGSGTPDATEWPTVSAHGANGETLYTFSGDTAGQAPTAASAEWVPYTGNPPAEQPQP